MVAVLSGAGTTTPEPCVHFTLASCPGHTLTALLAGEAPNRIPASDIPGANNERNDRQNDHK